MKRRSAAAGSLYKWVAAVLGMPPEAEATPEGIEETPKAPRVKRRKQAKKPQQISAAEEESKTPDAAQQNAAENLDVLTRRDIVEIKSLCNPPEMVKDVMSMVTILLTGDLKPTWDKAKKLLGNPADFVNKLKNFDSKIVKVTT